MQTSESVKANDMCSASWYAPTIDNSVSAIRVRIASVRTSFDGMDGNKEGYSKTLPEREEQNTLHTEEFSCIASSSASSGGSAITIQTYEAVYKHSAALVMPC